MRSSRQRLIAPLVLLATLWSPLPPAAIAQPAGCAPNPTTGCPLEFGQPMQAAITDPSDPAHLWRLNVAAAGSFAVVLTNLPARYRLTVYPPGAERQSDVLAPTTLEAGEYLFVEAPGPGTYNIFVDSPLNEISAAPYSLLAVRVLDLGAVISSVLSDPNSFQTWIVNAPTADPFYITLSNLEVDYDIALFDLDGNIIGRSDRPGAEEDVIALGGIAPGYYILVVTAFGQVSTRPYRLAIAAGAPPAPPPAPAPVVVEPTPAPPPAAGPLTESEIAARVAPAVVQVVTPFGLGSGVRIAQGIITNEHVVGGADRVEVVRSDGQRARATPVRCDPVLDLALLAVDLEIPPVDLAPARAQRQGDPVLVLGFPLPDVLPGQSSLTRGLISAIRQDERGQVVVQTDAAVNPGNSGGAMVNNRASLIALPAFKIRGTEGLNFGVASESIQAFLAGPDKPCSNGAAPGTVLLSDQFSDPQTGVMPLSSGSQRYVSRYLDGEYQIQLLDANWNGLPYALVPGAHTDASIAVDARIAGTIPGRIIQIGCRDPDGTGGYALLVEPGNTRAILARYDLSGASSTLTALNDLRSSPAIRPGSQSNRIELSCVGNTISASVNGTQVGSVRDTTYRAGQMWLAAVALSGTVDVRFDNLVVTRR